MSSNTDKYFTVSKLFIKTNFQSSYNSWPLKFEIRFHR